MSQMSRTVFSLTVVTALSLYGIPAWAAESKEVKVESKEIKYDYTKSVTGGVTPTGPIKGEPTKDEEPSKDPGNDPGKEEPEDEEACIPAGGTTEMVPTGEPGVVQIQLDPDFASVDCRCYDVDDGDNPGIPGGVAVSCNGSGGGQTFRNLAIKDGSTPGVEKSLREYVCGAPIGSTPHLTNAGEVMISYNEYITDLPILWGDNPSQPTWTNQFFGDAFAYTTGAVTKVTGSTGLGLPICEESKDEDEEPGKGEETGKEEPGKGEPSKAAAAAASKAIAPVVIKVEAGKKQ